MSASGHHLRVDVAVVGGGIAALWILDALDEAGFSAALVEPGSLGRGQTLSSQGIIHGGLKYTLRGLFTGAAEAISLMPERWRRALAGGGRPNLAAARVRSPSTWLWRSSSLGSKLALLGARSALRARPIEVERRDRPAILANAPGTVYRVDEPVLDTTSVVAAFRAIHAERMLSVAGLEGVRAVRPVDGASGGGQAAFALELVGRDGRAHRIDADAVVLAAGAWNEPLRALAGAPAKAMQRRPLHMAMVRGALSELHGHCVDGAATRVTISTSTDASGRSVWQLGGQLAEEGVRRSPEELLATARHELAQVLPDFDPIAAKAEWTTYRIDRAERAAGGLRPDDAQCLDDGPRGCLTVWPTKLALAPRAADLVLDRLALLGIEPHGPIRFAQPLEQPAIGAAPWDRALDDHDGTVHWIDDDRLLRATGARS
jgi:glycerol-3-phosphate dehydrogenase